MELSAHLPLVGGGGVSFYLLKREREDKKRRKKKEGKERIEEAKVSRKLRLGNYHISLSLFCCFCCLSWV